MKKEKKISELDISKDCKIGFYEVKTGDTFPYSDSYLTNCKVGDILTFVVGNEKFIQRVVEITPEEIKLEPVEQPNQ